MAPFYVRTTKIIKTFKTLFMTKKYITAPLPFQGQKRRFVNDFREALKHFNKAQVFVDLFGGSGLLSYIAKQERPDALIIYNDFDDYHIRIENISRTNILLTDIRNLISNYPVDKKISDHIKQQIIMRLEIEERKGYVDYITISSSLLFSMNYAINLHEMRKQTMYNVCRKSDYNAVGYLNGLEIVKFDYKELFEQYKDIPNVVFFVDPPYLSTDVSTYTSYWRLGEYLDVLNILKNNSFFYFTSNKSSILELCEWLENNLHAKNPFRGVIKRSTNNIPTRNASYNDIMLYKLVDS